MQGATIKIDCTFLQPQHQSKCRINAGFFFLRTNGTPCNTGCPVFVFVCMCVRVVSLGHLVDVQTFPDLRRCYVPEVLAQVAVTCKCCQLCHLYMQGSHVLFKLRHTGTWSAAAWPPRRMCYRPAVFFFHSLLSALSVPQGKIWRLSEMLRFTI